MSVMREMVTSTMPCSAVEDLTMSPGCETDREGGREGGREEQMGEGICEGTYIITRQWWI